MGMLMAMNTVLTDTTTAATIKGGGGGSSPSGFDPPLVHQLG